MPSSSVDSKLFVALLPMQVMPMSFRSRCTVSIQFFCGLPGFLFIPLEPQNMACLGSLLSSIRKKSSSHLSLLCFMISSIFSNCVSSLTLSLLTRYRLQKSKRWQTAQTECNLVRELLNGVAKCRDDRDGMLGKRTRLCYLQLHCIATAPRPHCRRWPQNVRTRITRCCNPHKSDIDFNSYGSQKLD